MSKIYRREIIFSYVPLKGYFRFKDIFQLLPSDAFLPKVPPLINHHPVIIEISYNKPDTEYIHLDKSMGIKNPIESDMTDMIHGITKRDEIIRLLTVFTNYPFFVYKFEQAWFQPFNGGGFDQSVWGQKGYRCSEFNNNIEHFSTDGHQTIEIKDFQNYYRWNPDNTISFPENLDHLFEKYYSLTDEEKKSFDSSCVLFCNGLDLQFEMNSLSFAALISAIETLIDYESEPTETCSDCNSIIKSPFKCDKCGNYYWGVRAKFRKFLHDYGSNDPEFRKYANKIYDQRSSILHKGKLLLRDLFKHSMSKFDEVSDEGLELRHLVVVTRICLINWLIKHK